jgi:glutaredoxin-related protein
MSFELPDFIHIVSTIDDFLSMSEPPCSINISNGYDEDEEKDDDKSFVLLTFPLKNGKSQIKMYDSFALFNYIESNGTVVNFTEFDDVDIMETNSSFKRSLKQIREFDRQQANTAKSVNTPIDRASFGLAEVN